MFWNCCDTQWFGFVFLFQIRSELIPARILAKSKPTKYNASAKYHLSEIIFEFWVQIQCRSSIFDAALTTKPLIKISTLVFTNLPNILQKLQLDLFIWWLVVSLEWLLLPFCLKILGKWRGRTNGTLSFYDWRLGGGDTQRWCKSMPLVRRGLTPLILLVVRHSK